MQDSVSPIPVINWHRVVGYRRAFLHNRYDNLLRLGRATADISHFTLPGQHVVLVNDADLAQQVLVDSAEDFDLGRTAGVFDVPLGGLFNAAPGAFRARRRMVAPAFQPRHIAAYADTITAYTERTQADWADGGAVDVLEEMDRLQMRILGRAVFGQDWLAPDDVLWKSQAVLSQFIAYRLDSPLRSLMRRDASRDAEVHQSLAALNAQMDALMAASRKSECAGDDILTQLLRARDEDGNPMPDSQIREELLSVFLGGHETVSSALTWAWYLLCRHPESYARLRQEAATVLNGRPPRADDLPRLPYASQVFKETLRLYPPAGTIARQALRDVRVGPYCVAAGALVWVNPLLMHRRSDYYPDPERFDPDRFAPERERALPRNAFMPFGGGMRTCMGKYFALMEGPLILAALAQRGTFALASHRRIRPVALLNIRPKGGLPAVFTRH